ncbi:hypothetical protein KIN20_034830 [Parelaphostrongylus tenuis]|uniref:Uncharacterized protein n=1 Tax=Parelaphostrongylus tenuis TaxID=148309 RepID=A0AAD5RAU1_PARTN|nr:hypothetical protein KIN20_034830 [Parelaphostrongylus tenuis]
MLKELNEAVKKIGLRINRMKPQFMKNRRCSDEHIKLEGSLITETSSYVHRDRSLNMENNMKEELHRRTKVA